MTRSAILSPRGEIANRCRPEVHKCQQREVRRLRPSYFRVSVEMGPTRISLALSILPWAGKRCVPTQDSDTIAFIVRLHFALQTSSIVANN
jgi:hypothetical protein